MTTHKALHPRDDVDRLYMCQEKKEEEDSLAFEIESMYRYNDYREGRLITPTKTIQTTQASAEQNNQKIKMGEKTTVLTFQATNKEISHEKTWTWLRKGNLKRETEPLQIAARNDAIRTNYVKARINKTEQNDKCR